MSRTRFSLALLALLALAAAGCGSSDDSTSDTSGALSASDCTPAKLQTQSAGQLTVATDEPAFPPYFIDNDPTNGKGFESAVAYAIAGQLGYKKPDVKWVVEPFNSSYAPGPKDFDFDVNQISITPPREKQVDFSSPYYTANQGVVALKGSDAEERGAGCPDRDHEPRRGQREDPARQRASGLQLLQRRGDGAEEPPDRRNRRGRADRALPDRGAGTGGNGGRAVLGAGR
jgi:ABC-type amino acid transport substrate-binding protein